MNTTTTPYSVFTTGHTSNTKTVESTQSRTAFLMVAGDSVDSLKTLGFSRKSAMDLAENGFWRYVVTDINESHDEGMVLHNTLSDTVTLFATGAIPIGIQINGFVLTVPGKDDRTNFLKLYSDRIRGRVLDRTRSVLYFGYKDTLMRLFITQMAISNDAGNEMYTNLIITGVASHYGTYTSGYQSAQDTTDNKTKSLRSALAAVNSEFELVDKSPLFGR